MRHPFIAAAVAAAAFTSLPAAAIADESPFLERFEGSWSGSGTVIRNESDKANKVTCDVTGKTTSNGLSIGGKCGAFIFSRDIRADLTVDAATGRYSGTYVGSVVGPARLSGKRQGDVVTLTVTWPKPVRGDTRAVMTIRNAGNGQFTMTVTDEEKPGGPNVQVTNVSLRQS